MKEDGLAQVDREPRALLVGPLAASGGLWHRRRDTRQRRERDVERLRLDERERAALLPAVRLRDPLLFRPRLALVFERFFFAPPSCLLTVAHARLAAVFEPTPRFLYPSSMCSAFRFCFDV